MWSTSYGTAGPYSRASFGYSMPDRQIDIGMAVDVGDVVRQRAQSEGVFVEVLRVVKQRLHKGAGANIVRQIAEDLIAERVVADVLNDASAVGVGVGLQQVLRRGIRKAGEQQRLDLLVPQQIDDLFMRQDGIRRTQRRADQQKDQQTG